MTKLGETILAGLKEARGILDGTVTEGFVVRTYTPVDVKAIRKRLKMSQVAFAADFGFGYDAVRDWELGRRRPTGAAQTLLKVIEKDPELVRAAVAESRAA